MDIESISTAMAQSAVQQQASLFVAKKSLNSMEVAGANVMKLIQSASNGDGQGQIIDVYC